MAKKQPASATVTPSLTVALELMAIPGISGQEQAIMDRICERLVDAGATASQLDFDTAYKQIPHGGQCGNLIVHVPGTKKGPRRMLSAHVDTVPVCLGAKPVVRGDRVESADPATGLGADDRAGSSVLLVTAERLLREKPDHYPVTFLWTVQEEVGLYGARFVKIPSLGKPKLAFNFDGGDPLRLTIGATGGYRMAIEVRGVASHAGAHPEEGVSAIAVAALAIADLQENGWHGLIVKGKKTGTSNVGVIRGGEATNVVTDRVVLRAEARSHDSKFRERIVGEIEKAFRRAAKKVKSSKGKTGEVKIDGQLDYDSFRLAKDDPSVATADRAIRDLGYEPSQEVSNGGLDANWLSARGVPTVTMGCGQHNIHTVGEYLDIAEYELACDIAWRLVQ
jgi:tripeptide aminopeptidase